MMWLPVCLNISSHGWLADVIIVYQYAYWGGISIKKKKKKTLCEQKSDVNESIYYPWTKLATFRVDPISDRAWRIGSLKCYLSCENSGKSQSVFPLNPVWSYDKVTYISLLFICVHVSDVNGFLIMKAWMNCDTNVFLWITCFWSKPLSTNINE